MWAEGQAEECVNSGQGEWVLQKQLLLDQAWVEAGSPDGKGVSPFDPPECGSLQGPSSMKPGYISLEKGTLPAHPAPSSART